MCRVLCIVCIVFLFPLLITYSEALKRSYDEPYTVAIAAPRLCRVLTVLKTTVVLSDGSVVHSDSSLNFSGQQYLRISSEEKKNGHSCLRDADDHSFWYWLI